ncbi:MAG: hypothetical protein NTX24_02515 [Candidatus Pacearchaeota archaeon]|nr:hypothetical protein [Candidatus Pacearchaeota archaeon]
MWCFTKETGVLMANLTYKLISDIKIGEEVVGKDKKGNLVFTKVKRTFKRKTSDLVKIKTDQFDLMCTPEHKFYYHSAHSHWTQAQNLKNKKIHWFGYGFDVNDEFKRGWLAGMSDGDGCFYRQGNAYHFRLKVKDEEITKNFTKWANYFEFPVRDVDYLKKYEYYISILTSTPKTHHFQEFLKRESGLDYSRGYLAGIFDAEGSGPSKVKQAVIYNSNLRIVKKVEHYLNQLKISYKVYSDTRRDKNHHNDNYHIKINNVPEFFVRCPPILERKRKNLLWMTLKSVKSRIKILDVININKSTEVYNLETETKNYIANGFLVHNCDHSDSFAQRDSGWIQLYCEDAQEAHDTIVQAYKIAEDKNVMLPIMVCIDGFTLSHVSEPVEMMSDMDVKKFLPKYTPSYRLNPKSPITMGSIAYPNTYTKFKEQQREAMESAFDVIRKTNTEFSQKFGRKYGDGLIEKYNVEKADHVIIAIGSQCSTIKYTLNELGNKKVGLIRIKSFRPFPSHELRDACKNVKRIDVIDRAMSLGNRAPLYLEIVSAINDPKIKMNSHVLGLGGEDITPERIKEVIK